MAENHPWQINLASKGATVDVDPELLFSKETGDGIFFDAHNGRPISVTGNLAAHEKIGGEQIIYPNPGLTGYKCIGSESVNGKVVEFWAKTASAGICRVDGVVTINSINFTLDPNFPLQIDKNEDAIGGEIYITDNNIPPFIFSIKDMLDSLTANPTKYFSNFDPLLYQVNLQSPLDRLAFIELINVGGGGGLPVGQYDYQMRYVTEAGDRTNWSHPTPLIPVMEALSTESKDHPWVKTYGGPPAPSSVTSFAPHLRFRVTNLYNYDFIEIKRREWNAGAGINFVPIGKVVAKISISPQEISVRDYIDPSESNTNVVTSENDETQQLVEILKAKTVRYFDKRLVFMNFETASRIANPTILKFGDGTSGFPVIDNLGYAGHKDPWNHVYRRKYMGGERFGFAYNIYDGVGTKFFANKIEELKNYQFPNRRDKISTNTSNYSYAGTVKAADTSINVASQTHEVFDLTAAIYKQDICNFKNIVQKGKILGLTGTRPTTSIFPLDAGVKSDCDEDNGVIENHGSHVSTLNEVSVSYQPFTPVSQNDPDVAGHDYVVNTKVAHADTVSCDDDNDSKDHNYRPPGFGPTYYTQGLMLPGLTNFPKAAKAFSVVRTDAAKRVVCQGIGFYSLHPAEFKKIGNTNLATKDQDKFWFYSPDMEQGIVSSDTLNDIIDNPQNYSIQCVSPLGFYSEVYSFEDALLDCPRDRIIDMVTYARMIRDLHSDVNNQINPGEDPNMGLSDGDGFNYVTYDKYRNISQNPNFFGSSTEGGNKAIALRSVTRKAEGRGQFLELQIFNSIYGKGSTGGSTERNFDDDGLKSFTEPFYIINIIRSGAEVRDQNIQKYKPTDFYQKLESVIGKGSGEPGNGSKPQKFILVDERWEDSIPAPRSTMFGAGTDRYIYIKKPTGVYEKWINVTYKSLAVRAAIEADIISLGAYAGNIKGVYTHLNIDNGNRFFEIFFYHATIVPQDGDLVIIKYDETAPLRVYGGDTYLGEAIFAPIDRKADAKSDSAETQFAFGIGFPFFRWKVNPRYYTIRKAGATLNVIQDQVRCKLGYLRQLCVMFTCETRAGLHLSYNANYPEQFFPLMNYVIRPNRWDDDKSIQDNGIFRSYVTDYTEDEKTQWQWGGFRFLQQINPDYAAESPKEFFSKPEFGFKEKTKFPTGIIWSLPRAVNVQDSPGLKTFAANSSFYISDDQGEIKRAWEATTDKGENLYAFTNKGICLLITSKSILSDLNSKEIAFSASNSFVQAQYWITKDIGMYDENWRGAIEGYVPVTNADGEEIRREAIYFPNNESVFCFMDNMAKDIARESGYYSKISAALKQIGASYSTPVTGGFNKLHQEYWLHIKGEVDNTFVYGQKNNMWHGTNDFKFDRFTTQFLQLFGHRDLDTYELHKGFIINGSAITYKLIAGSSPLQFWDKEFIRVRVNSPTKPTKINFYKQYPGTAQCSLDPSIVAQGTFYMKDYNGFEGWIPRIRSVVNTNRPRLQGRVLLYEIIHDIQEDFKVVDTAIQFKKIKL